MLRTLDEIREAGARAVANFPALTPQQVDTVARLIHPTVAVPARAAVSMPDPVSLPLAA